MPNKQASGDVSTGVVLPVSPTGTAGKRFPHLLDAISQIQQFYVIEVSGQEIPADFLTLRGVLNFFNIGFGAGFLEGLIFVLLMAIILPIATDEGLVHYLAKYFPLIEFKPFLWAVNLSPVLISGGLCCYMSKYYVGKVTKKAIDSLLLGRTFSLILKGFLVFVALIMLSKSITPKVAWEMAHYISFGKEDLATNIYYFILKLKPVLITRAFEVVGIFALAITMPFFTIWGVSWWRSFKAKRAETMWTK